MFQRCPVFCFTIHIFLLFALLLDLSTAFDLDRKHSVTHSESHVLSTPLPLAWGQPQEKSFTLRIMPLGASITQGYGTTPMGSPNGYRKPLRDQLRWRGWPVNMVGSMSDGDPVNFKNRQHEGHYGNTVAAPGSPRLLLCSYQRLADDGMLLFLQIAYAGRSEPTVFRTPPGHQCPRGSLAHDMLEARRSP